MQENLNNDGRNKTIYLFISLFIYLLIYLFIYLFI